MSVLEWLLVLEGVLLLTAGIFWVTGLAIGKEDPEDPFTLFYETFWRVFLRRRGRLRSAVSQLDEQKARQYAEMKQTGDVEGIRDLLSDELGDRYAFADSEIIDALDESLAIPSLDEDGNVPAMHVGGGAMAGDGIDDRGSVAQINIKVIPFGQCNELVSMRRDGISIQVTCGPEEGEANKIVLDLVAESLRVKPYQVTLVKGHYKPLKVVSIAGIDQESMDTKLAGYS